MADVLQDVLFQIPKLVGLLEDLEAHPEAQHVFLSLDLCMVALAHATESDQLQKANQVENGHGDDLILTLMRLHPRLQ